MRIVHVINTIDPSAGGPSAVVTRLASAQVRLGQDVSIVTGSDPARREQVEQSLPSVDGFDRVNLVKIEPPRDGVKGLFDTGFENALDGLAPIDAIHMHGVWDPPLLRASKWCRRKGVPYYIRPAGMLDDWSLEHQSLKKNVALAIGFRAMLRDAAGIHALNRHELETIRKRGFNRSLHQIPNGVFLEEIERETEPGAFAAKVEGLGGKPFALFLSRLHYKKGLDILAEAWVRASERVGGAHLVIAGPREDDSIDGFNARIEEAGLSGTVHVVGPIYGADKTAAFRDARCFVLPSRQEGFSVAITESLALGTPAVVTRDCHFPEVGEERTGVETSLDAGEVADGLVAMLGDADAAREAGARASALVRERFTWPAIARATLTMYGEDADKQP